MNKLLMKNQNLYMLLSMFVCLFGASVFSVKADTGKAWYQLRVKAVLTDGSPAASFVAVRGYYDQSVPTPSSNDYTMAVSSSTYGSNNNPDINLYGIAMQGEEFVGWYLDEGCTQLFRSTMTGEVYGNNCSTIQTYATSAEVQVQTLYAKFTPPLVNWTEAAEAPTTGKYYLYGAGFGGLASLLELTDGKIVCGTKDPNLAVLFTLTFSSATDFTISCIDEGETKYVCQNGDYIKPEEFPAKTLVSKEDGTYMVNLNNGHSGGFTWWEMRIDGSLAGRATFSTKNENNYGQRWMFVPEVAYNNLVSVESLEETGSITINSAPNASGTTNVKFNVSEIGPISSFDYTLTGGDGNFVLGTPTRSGNVITVPVTYTAQNVHSGTSTPISVATVTLTAKNEAASSASGVVPVYVNLFPQFALNVDELDWSYDGDDFVEMFYAGMEVAASQRDRLQNKLIYNPAQTTGVAANFATWTATIIGENADQFKFANGTQTVSGLYTPELLDVIFAPTEAGTMIATLHIETSYTDANSAMLKCQKDIALSGTAQEMSLITFAADGNQSPSANESYSYGDIIGTNGKDVSVDLFMAGVSGLTKTWSDPDGVFEFDVNTVDLTKNNQTLIFRAHHTTPVTTATNHTATLTISGTGSEGAISAVLTLTYQALPLLMPEVTWNWTNIPEATTVTNPITTTSDGAWTLTKTAGDKLTYNAETKTATAAYLHHEPGITATFTFSIAQTDTYAAMNETYTANISSYPEEIHLTTNTQFNDPNFMSHTSWENFDESKHELYVDYGDNVDFFLNGHSMMSFSYHDKGTTTWTITEFFSDNSSNVAYSGRTFTEGFNVFSFNPTAVKLRIRGSGSGAYFTDVRFSDKDTLTVDYDHVTLINDAGTIHDLDVTATFANTYSANVTLNAAAAQYFEMQTAGKASGASLFFDENDLGLGNVVEKVIKITLKEGADATAAAAATAGGACAVTFGDTYTYNHHEFSLPIVLMEAYDVRFKHHANGTYKVQYEQELEATTVSTEDYVEHLTTIDPSACTVTISEPTPAAGYKFQGWKIDGTLVSLKSSITKLLDKATTVEPVFEQAEGAFKIDAAYFDDLTEALSVAGSVADQKPIVVLMKDTLLSMPTTYTIPAGVTLLIPHRDNYYELETSPEMVIATAETLYAYRTLTLREGVNFVVNGNLCIGGKIMAAGGGNKSAYVTGGCAVINMANGGHIELNDGANLYCWGFIKGQDMDQGNNTQGTGTVTANSGAKIWEDFYLGDWRGGTASSNIYFEKDDKMLFPFQSYSIQNIEIPTTYKYGSKLMSTMAVHTGYGDPMFSVATIGSDQALFLLQDEESIVRKWYDPTTDLSCFELNGTALLGSLILNLPFVGEFDSGDCNLPISNSMHVIIANCNMTLAKPLLIQAGAVLEIKNTATVNLVAPIHMFDVDEWGLYIHNYYFRSFKILTSHKNRGAENSKAGLDDAKVIIDGTLNVKAGLGKIYATTGGANLMGNGGGKIVFEGALPSAGTLWQVNVLSGSPYITWVENPEAAANLRNEDGSYTKSSQTTYYNIHGRWFYEESKDELEDHTYNFYYLDNGNTGDEEWTAAVYSHDKTGLEARMKWFNVTPDANCPKNPDPEADLESDWWLGTNPTAYYNYSMLGEWHQFIATETENVYSGSNNVLYRKADCDWAEEGYIDENCLYTIGGVKKALVDGHFIPLTSNGYDPAYHKTDDESKYYICFTGCNWHEATPFEGESKAYTIEPEAGEFLHYIWFEDNWLNVERDGSFFYTADELTNVKTYYEYVDGEWLVATPFIRVEDAMETREFFMIQEAFNVAALKKDVTITILRDVNVNWTPYTFTNLNTNCTLDLNGHVLDITVTGSGTTDVKMFAINMGTGKFTITDNSEYQLGEFRLHANPNTATQSKRWYGIYLTAGELEINAGKVYAEDLFTYTSTSNAGIVSAVAIAGGQKFTLDGNGEVEAKATYATYGVHLAASTTTTGKTYIKDGTITATTTSTTSAIGLYIGSGTAYVSGGTINALTKTTTSRGIYVEGSASNYIGHLEMTGGTVNATATTTTAYGIYVGGNYTFNNTKPNTIKATFRGVANISGGIVNAEAKGTTTAYAIVTLGTTDITGGTFNTKTKTTTTAGILAQDGTVTVSGTAEFNVRATTTTAYGIYANGATPADKTGRPYNPVVTVNGGTFNVSTLGTTTCYGIIVNGATRKITSTSSGYYAGNYASAGTVIVNDGIFNVTAKTKTVYAANVGAAATQAGATDYDPVTANPKCIINGGYFKLAGTSGVNALATTATTDNQKVNGGYFSHSGNLATYAVTPNQVITLTTKDANYPTYKYKVAEAYTVTFKYDADSVLQTGLQELNEPTIFAGKEPTKANTTDHSYIFDGWATEEDGEVVYAKGATLPDVTADATYYAHFTETVLKWKITWNANGGVCDTEFSYVTRGSKINTVLSALPAATRTGYTLAGWYTKASGGSVISTATKPTKDVTYYAHWTANKHNLTWEIGDAVVTTAGTGAELDATGTLSSEVAFNTAITKPVVTRAGYTFAGWDATPVAKMPDNDVTYTATWTPNTNTPYVVKHMKENPETGEYDIEAASEEFTGTTGTYVTPKTNSYSGYVTPAAQTIEILADGSQVVTYNYSLINYTITLDANGGTCATTSVNVKHGATPTLPIATKEGVNCSGWFTKAIGGDKITDETAILYYIGTLYAQYEALNVTAPLTISEDRTVTDLRITTTGSLTIAGSAEVTVHNFILESNGATASGQLVAGFGNLTFEHAYFDLKLNAKNHQWYAVAVPWQVDATSGVSVNGKTLELGKDFDIIYYDGTRRATEGKQKCWSYVEDDGDKTLVPGRLYMIGLMSDAATVRFKKTTGALSTTTTSVAAHASTTGDETDKGWNGVANPALFHAFVNPGVTEGQVYVPDQKRYETVTLNTTKFVVGEGAFVQVESDKSITVVKDGAFAAPRRTRAQANLIYDVRIAPANGAYTDRLFIKTTDSKENVYTVGQDLAKVGVSSIVPQMWINRYDAKLCVNTAELISETAEYPLGISVPANGEYTISLAAQPNEDYTVYLTLNGEAIWNLGNGEYTLTLSKGTSNEYGLRISAKSPAVATGVDEAVVDAQGEIKKVIINDQVFIIRGENVYTIDGQLVK